MALASKCCSGISKVACLRNLITMKYCAVKKCRNSHRSISKLSRVAGALKRTSFHLSILQKLIISRRICQFLSAFDFFRFPKKNTNLFEHWKNIIEEENAEKLIDISKSMCVCSEHFTPDQFHSKLHPENSNIRVILKSNAFPNVFDGSQTSFMVEILPSEEVEAGKYQKNHTEAIENVEIAADKSMEIVDEPATSKKCITTSRSTLSESELVKIGSAEIARMDRLQLEQTATNAILKLKEKSRTISALRNKIKVLKKGKDRLMKKNQEF